MPMQQLDRVMSCVDSDQNGVFLHIIFPATNTSSSHTGVKKERNMSEITYTIRHYYKDLCDRSNIRQRLRASLNETMGAMPILAALEAIPRMSPPKRASTTCLVPLQPEFYSNSIYNGLTVEWSNIAFLQSLLCDDGPDDDAFNEIKMHNNVLQSLVVTSPAMATEDYAVPQTTLCSPIDSQWWNRPVWAWTVEERQLAHGTVASLDFVRFLSNAANCDQDFIFVVSNSKNHNECMNHIDTGSRNDILLAVSSSPPPVTMIHIKTPKAIFAFQHDGLALISQEFDEESCIGSKCSLEEWADEDDVDTSVLPFLEELATSLKGTPNIDDNDEPKGEALQSNEAAKGNSVSQMTPSKSQEPSNISETIGNEECRPVESSSIVFLTPSPVGATLEKECQKTPQIDSAGVDFTMLSQLPPNIRSEARLVMALAKQDERKRQRHKIPKNSVFERWLCSKATDKDGHVIQCEKEQATQSPVKRRKKARTGIQKYFHKA